MLCFPNAKINIGLKVVEKRPDGFHNLETVFYPIGLKDALEVVPYKNDNAISIHVTGLNATEMQSNVESNIVTRAYYLLQSDFDLMPLSVFLHKAIPTGAGLGGGSSDAASALILIQKMNKLNLSDAVLQQYSAQLGADCAFFIKNNPIFATGIGNCFEEVSLNLAGMHLILIKPDIHVSTPEAYSMVKPFKPDRSLKELIERPLDTWKDTIENDFEASVFAKYPKIASIKDVLYRKGAVYASMSGSGSSVFGLFKEQIELKSDFSDCFYWSETLRL